MKPGSKPNFYQRRCPERTVVYQVVQQQMESWLQQQRQEHPEGKAIPVYVERDLRAFLECGILAYGFARAHCDTCGHDFLIAFSCKGRGICPSCNTRRMVETAVHLVENVLPEVPLRQIVVSFPKWLRYYITRDNDLFNRIIRISQSEIEHILQTNSPGTPSGSRGGGIVFIHRFGASLNLHPHLHLIVIDGVITAQDQSFAFHPAYLNQNGARDIREAIRTRILKLIKRRGLLDAQATDNLKSWGHGGGFSVHADVQVAAHDKAGRERLLRYCARPMFAGERLSWLKEGERLRYHLNKPGPKGETELILTADEFLDRIATLIPPPRKHRHRYVGILAPNSPWRKAVVARAGLPIETDIPQQAMENASPGVELDEGEALVKSPGKAGVSRWAILIARIYEVFPLCCPQCGGEMRVIAFIEDIEPIQRILTHIGEPTKPPLIHPPRSPPEWVGFDQTTIVNENAYEVDQDCYEREFDQSVSW